MKQLFLDMKSRLNTITGLTTSVDLFKGQVNTPPTSGFPYAWIDFPYSYYKDSSAKVQLGYVMVKVILCFDVDDLTGADATDVFDLKDQVYSVIQGSYTTGTVPNLEGYAILTRGGERTETKYAGIYLFELDFYTTIKDTVLYTKKNFVDAHKDPPDYVTGNNPIDLEIDRIS